MAKKGEVNANVVIGRVDFNVAAVLDACRTLDVTWLMFDSILVDMGLLLHLDDKGAHIYGDVVVAYANGKPIYKADILTFLKSKVGTRNVMIKFGSRTLQGTRYECGIVTSRGVRVDYGPGGSGMRW